VSFDRAIRTVLQKYAIFSGRASRSEYWFWILAFWIGWYIVVAFTRIYPIYELSLFVPTLAVGVRRLHDSNHSGWWIVVPLANLFLLISPPVEPNRFGSDARESTTPTYIPGPMNTTPTYSPASLPPSADQDDSAGVAKVQTCPSCGTERQEGQNFCQSCGTKFD
jgi:uncharacterized membrane protein YhaH (DUF805 family)